MCDWQQAINTHDLPGTRCRHCQQPTGTFDADYCLPCKRIYDHGYRMGRLDAAIDISGINLPDIMTDETYAVWHACAQAARGTR